MMSNKLSLRFTKKGKCYRIHSGLFPRSKPVCKYYVSNFNLLMLWESKQWCVLVNRLMHHSLWLMGFSLLIERGLDKILAILIKSGGGEWQDKKHMIGNNQLGAKLQHCSTLISAPWTAWRDSIWSHKQCSFWNSSIPRMVVHVLSVWAAPFGWPSLENIQPAWKLILTCLQLCPVAGAASSEAFRLDSPVLHHWKRWEMAFQKSWI